MKKIALILIAFGTTVLSSAQNARTSPNPFPRRDTLSIRTLQTPGDTVRNTIVEDIETRARNRRIDTRSPGTNGGTNPPINPTTGRP